MMIDINSFWLFISFFNHFFFRHILNYLSNLRNKACVNIFINKAFSLRELVIYSH